MKKIYSFGASKFSDFVWLNNGHLFKNPDFLEIEMVTKGKFSVEVVRVDGSLEGAAHRENSGWSTVHFRTGGEFGGGVPNGEYKIRLKNAGPGERDVKQGNLEYDV